jgi:hypothetical protein
MKSETPVILCVIHHRQNPIESTLISEFNYLIVLSLYPGVTLFVTATCYFQTKFRRDRSKDKLHSLNYTRLCRVVPIISGK